MKRKKMKKLQGNGVKNIKNYRIKVKNKIRNNKLKKQKIKEAKL